MTLLKKQSLVNNIQTLNTSVISAKDKKINSHYRKQKITFVHRKKRASSWLFFRQDDLVSRWSVEEQLWQSIVQFLRALWHDQHDFLNNQQSEILKNRYLLTVSIKDNVARTFVTSTEFAFFTISQNNAHLSSRCIEFSRKLTTIVKMHNRLFVTMNTKRQFYALTIFEHFKHTNITSQSFRTDIKERRIISLKKLNLEKRK